MSLINLFEASTKSGLPITFERELDIKGDKNRGWQVDRIYAFVDDERAGHISVAYIPKERFARYYPSVFNFLSQIHGRVVLPYAKQHLHYSKFTKEELEKFIYDIKWSILHTGGDGVVEYPSREAALQEVATLEKQVLRRREPSSNQSYGEAFLEFADVQVDKPHVSYSLVLDHVRGQHVGIAMYIEMAKWLQSRGLYLHADGLQTESAQGVWKYFESKGMVKLTTGKGAAGNRRYLVVPDGM